MREDPRGYQGMKKGPVGAGHELRPQVAPKPTAVTRKISVADRLWTRPWHKLGTSSFPSLRYPRDTMEKSSTFQPFRR